MEKDDLLILDMQGVVKEFSGTRVLDRVDFDVCSGEVHALIGENGAGKSTLMNVLAGRFDDYEGRILFEGEEVRITNPRQALDMGIAVIHQDLSVLGGFTVAENIMLGDERYGRWTRKLDRRIIHAEARRILDYLGYDLDPDELVGGLGTARQCLVEIAGAVRRNVKILVFDEPTASLGDEEVDRLFQVIHDLKQRGLGMIYISHRLAELPRVADRVTVLRDGVKKGTRSMADCRISELTRMMLGHDLAEVFPERRNRPGEVVLEVRGLTRPGVFEDVSFTLRRGEILGIAGLVGSGRTEIARALYGVDKAMGTIEYRGQGMGLVPENRKTQGIITGRSVRENIAVSVLDRLSGALGFLKPRRITDLARSAIDELNVDPPREDMEIDKLSGGNQQKAIVGRWLVAGPEVLIFDEPTRGIDVGTKSQIYKLIANLAEEGRAVILISSELLEITKLADRILVVREGRCVNELDGGAMDEDALFAECAGKAGRP